MFTTSFRTRSHEEFLALQNLLTQNVLAGLLNPQVLSAAIDKYYDDGDYIDRSIGTCWIISNPALFEQVVTAGERLQFLMDHLDRPHSSEVLICHAAVLETLPTVEDRCAYVHEAFVLNGARNNNWVETALKVGVPKEGIFNALLDHLKSAPAEDPKSCTVTPFSEFLAYGDHGKGHGGRAEYWFNRMEIDDPASWLVPAESPWGICNYAQFKSLVKVCAEKAPHRVFEHWRKLSARLRMDDVKDVLLQAASHLQSFTGDVEAWMRLEQSAREYVLEHLQPGDGKIFTQLMVHTVLASSNGPALCHKIMLNVAKVDALTMFLTALPILEKAPESPNTTFLTVMIEARLRTAGYIIGTVQEGTYLDRKKNVTRRQLFVEAVDGTRYIADRDSTSRTYYSRVGDDVVFNPSKVIRRLTPRVCTVRFIPVDASRR